MNLEQIEWYSINNPPDSVRDVLIWFYGSTLNNKFGDLSFDNANYNPTTKEWSIDGEYLIKTEMIKAWADVFGPSEDE